LRGSLDHVAIDGVEFLATEMLVQPAQFRLVFLSRCLVRLFLAPAHDGVVPGSSRALIELLLSPRLRFQPVVVLARFGLVASFSTSSYSLA